MTRIAKGDAMIPVTLIQVPKLTVFQVKTIDKDGYEAVVLEMDDGRNKPVRREVSLTENLKDVKTGDEVTLDIMEGVTEVKVIGISKGKGFAGAMKRWNFKGGPSRVGSKFHRALGSIGTRKPRRTKPGRKMHGHLGLDQVTIHTPVELVLKDRNLVAVKGPIPGARNSIVVLHF